MPRTPLSLLVELGEWSQSWTKVPRTGKTAADSVPQTNLGPAVAADVFLNQLQGPSPRYSIALAAVDTTGMIHVNYLLPGNNDAWVGWQAVPGAFRSAQVPVSAMAIEGKLYLYAVGLDEVVIQNGHQTWLYGHVYWNSTTDGDVWSGWTQVSGVEKTKTPVSASPDGSLFLVGLHGGVWINSSPTTDAGGWTLLRSQFESAGNNKPFDTNVGVAIGAGNSYPDSAVGPVLFGKPAGNHNILALSASGAAEWAPLPDGESGATNRAIATARFSQGGYAAGFAGGSFLFLTTSDNEINCSSPYFSDPANGQATYAPTPSGTLSWSSIPGLRTNATPGAAVSIADTGGRELVSQTVYLFAKGVDSEASSGDIWYNSMVFGVVSATGPVLPPVKEHINSSGFAR